MNYVEHTFGAGETIEGVIRKYNSHAMTAEVSRIFMKFYVMRNGESTIPRLGDTVDIPVDARIAKMQI